MQSEIAGVSDITNYLVTNHVNPTQKYKLAFKVQHNSRIYSYSWLGERRSWEWRRV